METITFNAKLSSIAPSIVLLLPSKVSALMPSRGMVMAEGTMNRAQFELPLEPDGRGGHWLRISPELARASGATIGETVTLRIKPSKIWPNPDIPKDLQSALSRDVQANKMWVGVTTRARWEWIRWINGTRQPETRQRRINLTCSKLRAGKRTPCCFNRNRCSQTDVSRNGVLLDPS